jgi:hypothetical protein
MEVVKFLGLLALTWLFVEGSQPVQFIKKLSGLHPDSPSKDLTRRVLTKLFNCALCSGFWIGLIYYAWTGGPFILMACLVSICAEIFARILNLLFNRILNQL